jgi:hypothetical protein
MTTKNSQAVTHSNGIAGSKAKKQSTKAHPTDIDGEPAHKAINLPAATSSDGRKIATPAWKRWGTKVRVRAATIIRVALAGLLSAWLLYLAGPHIKAPPATSPNKPIINPGHLPGRKDVSTMSPGKRFYAIPNFYYDSSCGRPCWLPLYESPSEQSAFLTNGWPCEYYGPNYSSEPSCVRPPRQRTPGEMADPSQRNSGDRVLIICQVRSQATQDIRNQVGQSSNIWDMVAIPASYISPDSPAGRLRRVPGMPGFYEGFAPNMWLGNTGWHHIPCESP